MSFKQFLNLILKNLKWLVLIPLILGASIFYFTRNETKLYDSEAVIYTGIASGYNLNGNSKVDFFAATNAFDNFLSIINSRETKEEVAVNLLASHLFLAKPDPSVLGWNAYKDINKLVPPALKQKFVRPTLAETVSNITSYMHSSDTNEVYKLVYSDNPFYSLKALANIKAARISSSDLLKISYETCDAAICKNTLELLMNVFVRKQKVLKGDQTESVIAFFESEVKLAAQRLDSTEQVFLQFHEKNDVINFYEQTKAIIGEQVDLNMLGNSLEMDKTAQNKGLDKINNSIKGREYQSVYGSDILSQRSRLSDIYNKIAFAEVSNSNNPLAKQELDSLKKVSEVIENNMKASLNKLYVQTNTPNGIPTKDMLDEWVKSTVAVEQSKARLGVMNTRKREFESEFRKLAPLGAMLKKVERDIDVQERQYLELLSSLNTARLAQQSNELSSKIKVLDPPFFPLKPIASKRVFMVLVGAVAGFILVLASIIANFMVNKNLQQPIHAAKKIGLDILSVYPVLMENESFVKKANLRLMQQLFSRFDFTKKPLLIGVCSIKELEGKTTIIEMCCDELRQLHYKVEHIEWNNSSETRFNLHADVVFIEFSSLENTLLTSVNMPVLDHAIMLCRANRQWGVIDKELLDIFVKTTSTRPLLILNGVDTDFAEEFVGKKARKKGILPAMTGLLSGLTGAKAARKFA